jgi:hypothetical protein
MLDGIMAQYVIFEGVSANVAPALIAKSKPNFFLSFLSQLDEAAVFVARALTNHEAACF